MQRPALKLLTALVGLALAQGALAQNRPTPTTSNPPSSIGSIPFDLLPPGARSLGLGGAFTAVADDATASEANPAGLTILTRPEISLHGRRTSFDLRDYNGDGTYADTYNGRPTSPIPLFTRIDDDTTALSFASFVYPFENGAVSVYYQNTGKVEGSSHDTALATSAFDQFTFDNSTDINVEALGISGAYRLNDLVSVGASLRYARLDVKALQRTTVNNFFDFELRPDGSVNTAGITDVVSIQRSVDDDDRDLTFNLGVLVNPGGKLSFGVVYKDGGSYELTGVGSIAQTLIVPAPVNLNLTQSFTTVVKAKVDLPDSINMGLAYRPTDQWLFALDAHYVRYHELPPLPSTSLLFGNPAPGATLITTPDGVVAVPIQLNDAMSFHFGVERVFVFEQGMMMGMNSLALRAGVFNEKDLGGYNRPSGPPRVPLSTFAPSDRQVFDTRDTHYTVGVGSTFGQHVQVDLAAEFSKDTDNLVLSAIYRF